jgi:glycine dehydrogenase subunit 2
MHINLHKTFSTPHGGGGPGAGPVVLSAALAPYAPVPFLRKGDKGIELVEHAADGHLGRITAFNGQMGMYVRALTYMLSHGGDGLAQAAKDAVLNANYIRARLQDVFTAPFGDQPCMHEALFDDHFLDGTGISTLDFAKALIDEGYHPMTMYFPLVVHGAMLIEPTESEPKQTLDAFCDTMLELAAVAKAGDKERFTTAPVRAPLRRLDETRAARSPKLKWEREEDLPVAAQ